MAEYIPKYPTKFYAKTIILWACFIVIGQLALFGCIMGPLFWCDIIKAANGRPGYEAGIPMTIIGLLFMPLAIMFMFQLMMRQLPMIVVYKEGLKIRQLGYSLIRVPIWDIVGFGFILALLSAIWYLITLRMFYYQTIYIKWADITIINCNKGHFDFFGRAKNRETSDEFEQIIFNFGQDSFSIPPEQVGAAIQYFRTNYNVCKNLESWQNDEFILE